MARDSNSHGGTDIESRERVANMLVIAEHGCPITLNSHMLYAAQKPRDDVALAPKVIDGPWGSAIIDPPQFDQGLSRVRAFLFPDADAEEFVRALRDNRTWQPREVVFDVVGTNDETNILERRVVPKGEPITSGLLHMEAPHGSAAALESMFASSGADVKAVYRYEGPRILLKTDDTGAEVYGLKAVPAGVSITLVPEESKRPKARPVAVAAPRSALPAPAQG
jgi:hypothetical protein